MPRPDKAVTCPDQMALPSTLEKTAPVGRAAAAQPPGASCGSCPTAAMSLGGGADRVFSRVGSLPWAFTGMKAAAVASSKPDPDPMPQSCSTRPSAGPGQEPLLSCLTGAACCCCCWCAGCAGSAAGCCCWAGFTVEGAGGGCCCLVDATLDACAAPRSAGEVVTDASASTSPSTVVPLVLQPGSSSSGSAAARAAAVSGCLHALPCCDACC
mmetsp:Transcript_38026/g.84681  ORF Transcript_38026/g.84681 Transcript_38026/m.84681 type:complete len:212 (-) Transcript_38026:492-1127(-)